MSLDTLRDLSISIIQSSVTHPLGLVKLPSSTSTPFNPKEQRLLDLHRELDTLNLQVAELRESGGLHEKRRRLLAESGISESSLLERLEAAQNDYFKARQDNANKDIISQSLLRVNPTLKATYATRTSLNSAERELYPSLARRDLLASQLMRASEEYTKLQEELSSLQVNVLNSMRENKQIYADVERLASENERTRLSTLSPAEKEQLSDLEQTIAQERVLREIVRNVLQGLILNSGLNWAADEELLNAMLLCGEDITI